MLDLPIGGGGRVSRKVETQVNSLVKCENNLQVSSLMSIMELTQQGQR